MKRNSAIIFVLILVLGQFGCSKLKDDLPSQPEVAGIHKAGFADPVSPDFHAIALRAGGGDYSECQRCHGTDLKGGLAGKSCADAGCHGAGYHAEGFGDKNSPNFHIYTIRQNNNDWSRCTSCHGKDLSGTALSNGISCLASGCHGKGLHGVGFGDRNSPNFHIYTIRQNMYDLDGCKTCHGADYSGTLLSNSTSCSSGSCHVAADNGPEACYSCHGNSATKSPHPPESLNGSSTSTERGVGAHVAHLTMHTLSNTVILCTACHAVPAAFGSPGHIDPGDQTPVRAEVSITDTLAFTATKGRITGQVQYNFVSLKCENTYCHGNFTNGNNFQPQWNGTDQATCGTCHGDAATGSALPKAPHVQFDQCGTCHAETMNDDHKTFRDRTKHMDGKLQVLGATRTDW